MHNRVGWFGESTGHLPFPPNPSPPLPNGPIRLDKATKAHVHDGLGAIIDASSRFLFDYPEPQRSAILDYLFKPGFGASLDICKVEVGGDAQQTDGSTASYIHNVGEAVNFNRSHIWWAMREAKARNPRVLFYGLAWGFPGHVGGGDFYSLATGKYLARWAQGAAQYHGLNVSVLGLWNERMPCKLDNPSNRTSWNCTMVFGLRAALDDAGLKHVRIAGSDHSVDTLPMLYSTGAPIDIVATHGYGALPVAEQIVNARNGWPRWRSESEDPYTSPSATAAHLVQNYVYANVTASIAWPAVQGFYPSFPWGEKHMWLYANSPWSGHYRVPAPIWVLAHLGQFVEPGWRYLRTGEGSGPLPGGGHFISLISSDGDDLTIVIETSGLTDAQNITFVIPQSCLHGNDTLGLERWQSNLTTDDPTEYFLKQTDVSITRNGSASLTVPGSSLLTLTTRRGKASKGTHPDPPPATPFPLPYRLDYDTLERWRQAPYQLDQQGSFEVEDVSVGPGLALGSQDGGRGQVRGLLQTVRQMPIQWVFATPRPLSILGNPNWTDVTVTANATILEPSSYPNTTLFDCSMQHHFLVPGTATKLPTPLGGTFVSVGVRSKVAGNICDHGRNDTTGYFLLVHANRTFTITKGSQHVLDSGTIPPAAISGIVDSLIGVPLRLQMSAEGSTIRASLNGHHLSTVQDSSFGFGFVSIATGWHRALFTSIAIV